MNRQNILLVLVICIAPLVFQTSADDENCYDGLGCFPITPPWKTILRPFPAPFSPTKIDTKIYYYSRTSTERFNISLWPDISLNGADFDGNRPATAFMTHGFASDGNVSWLCDLKDNYLKRLDANVFIIDWGNGAKTLNYLQVASNIRIVGAEAARFVHWLIDKHGLNVSTCHLLGHSLGAHASAYIAKSVHNISRLTGFDAAQPGFETAAKEVRLDKEDADFVELLHTNGLPFLPFFGFGLMHPHGHVDFYLNGGLTQPGCKSALQIMKDLGSSIIHLKGIKDLVNQTVDDLSKYVGCSHGYSYIYFTEALVSNCSLWGQKTGVLRQLLDAGTGGFLAPLFTNLKDCTEDTCLPIGLDTPYYKARGTFSVSTGKTKPFCNDSDRAASVVLSKLKEAARKTAEAFRKIGDKLKSIGSSIKDTVTSIFG